MAGCILGGVWFTETLGFSLGILCPGAKHPGVNQLRRSLPAVWAALLAVLLQLSLGPAAMAASAAPMAVGMAHVCGQAPDAPSHPAHHGGMDCSHCPLCTTMGVHAALMPPAPPVLVAPTRLRDGVLFQVFAAVFHRAAPAAFEPRGPPVLV
jgi:hypothetical protein